MIKYFSTMLAKSTLKNKDFLKLLTSQITSLLAQCIINYLLILKIYAETNSAYAITLLWFAYSIPVILIGPFASTIVDMVNRKTLLIFTNLFQAITILLFVPVADKYMLIYTVVFVYSLLNQFYLPAESAYVPCLFKNSELAEANGVFYLTKQVSTFVGYAAAGFLNKFLGFETSLLVCAFIALIAFFSVLTLPSFDLRKKVDIENTLLDFLKEVINGYKFIKNNKNILYPLIFISAIDVCSTIFALNVPAIAKQVLNTKIEDAAILIVTPVLLGTILGVLVFPKLLGKTLRKKTLVENSLILVVVSLVSLTAIGFVNSWIRLALIPVSSIIFGLAFMGIFIPVQTYLQEAAPKNMLGRIFGNIWFIVTLASIIPLTLSASIIELLGARSLVFAMIIFALFSRFSLHKFLEKLDNTSYTLKQSPTK
ncbi:MFS transporter [candidate division WWE3 bacterium]|uniref:MFS transporter n=1 Tax=candidate division WWE3 bacterium TaxID=2053526 RepID=A0A7X9HSZ3_UNCKA|nr:MFS transporter [candidate division WWE3 bacterium]